MAPVNFAIITIASLDEATTVLVEVCVELIVLLSMTFYHDLATWQIEVAS